MSRVKKAVHARKYRRTLLSKVKGYRFARSKKEAAANDAMMHAGAYSFAHRRDKKGDFRRLWNIKINAALRSLPTPISYSKFMGAAKKANLKLDRKSLAHLAETKPKTFEAVVAKIWK
jgi:large subunit ribosomal protein L20